MRQLVVTTIPNDDAGRARQLQTPRTIRTLRNWEYDEPSGASPEEENVNIAEWLHGLGLQQYEKAFRENEIDATVLPELTAEDLRDIGVHLGRTSPQTAHCDRRFARGMPAGTGRAQGSHRYRRHRGTTATDRSCSATLSGRPRSRRGSIPRISREIIAAYHRTVAAIVAEAGGFVARYMGDGVLIYFGYPQAHEDDAERAVRAGLSASTLSVALMSGP